MRNKNFSNNPETELLRLRNLLDSAGDGFIMHDLQGHIVDVNDTLCRVLGYSIEEMLNLKVSDIEQDEKLDFSSIWEKLYKNNLTHVTYGKHKCKNGKLHPVEMKLFAVENDGTPYISAFVRDISDRKVIEETLNLTQFAIDNAADAALWLDATTHTFIYANRKACEYLGYSQEELLTMGIPDIDAKFTEDAWPEFVSELKKINEVKFETDLVKKDNSHFSVEITANHMEYENKFYVIAFIREISARKQAEKELHEAKEKSEKANKAKSEFLTSMSHELKTPLNAIIGYSEMLAFEASPELPDEQMHFARSINQAGIHLLGLIDDVLDLATIESGKVSLEFESVDLRLIVEHSIAITRLMAEKKKVTLGIDSSTPQKVIVWADKKKLTQVVLNLITNAIKYNRENGAVEIEFILNENTVQINIKDTGHGIPESKKSEIFLPFNRLGKENSDIEGTGVGLVICKSLIELMGGNMGFESEAGKGSCFYFLIAASEDSSNEVKSQLSVRKTG